MNKLLSIAFAGLFAVASTAAVAQDKKAEPKKEEAKPAATATAPAKKEEAKPAAAAPAKKEEAKKKEKKGGC